MSFRYRVKTVVLSSGERLPVLLGEDGVPMFEATVFALTEVRGRSLATSTIGSVLRSVMAFHRFLDSRGIDLEARFATGEVLSLGEVEDLARFCRAPLTEQTASSLASNGVVPKVVSLEKVRMEGQRALPAQVAPDVAATRLRYIRGYVQWLVGERRSRHGLPSFLVARLGDSSRLVVEAIDTRIPHHSGRDVLHQREGIPEESIAEILRVVDPHSSENPWRDQHTRYRNALFIRWLLYLGLRIGEALGVRISDIVVYRREVTIHRRADDPEDPRRNQPQTKTRARVLLLREDLLAETQAYILEHRSMLSQAKKHPFLFVASRTGQPLSLAAVAKLFRDLRKRCPWLPAELTGHVLRHTWNDEFSKMTEAVGMTPEREQQARSYLMGWSPTSDTAATYTRRYVRNKAQEVSLGLQGQLMKKNRGKDDE